MKPSRVKQILNRGEAVAVPSLDRIFSPRLVEILAMLGYDCVWIDMEHSDLSYERLAELACAARVSGIDVILRIAKGSYSNIIRPLELGVNGLVLPHCKSPAEAKDFVRMSKFTPVGLRGLGQGIDWKYGLMDFQDYIRQANEETLIIPQIEDKEAVERIQEIAAVPGVDGLFIGPFDLSQSYGVAGQTDHPLVQNAIDTIAKACAKHGKWWGIPASPGEQMRKVLAKGARFIHCSQEVGVFIRGFRAALELAKADFCSSGLLGEGKEDA